jgi:gliding motility-associated-like protein
VKNNLNKPHQLLLLILISILLVYINVANAQNCITSSSYTMNPPPVGGQYQTGQTVQICATFTFSQAGAIWVHGIVPIIPAGWNVSSLQVTPPNSCSGSGVWGWYNSVTGNAGTAGTHGPGIFYNQGFDSNPGNNFGDNCLGAFSFCITLTTSSDCGGGTLNGSNLNITFQILGDNQSGSWTSSSCGISTINTPPALSSTLNCCAEEDIVANLCNPGPITSLINLLDGPTPGGTWTDPLGNNFNGLFTPGTNSPGIYNYNVNVPGCTSTSTVEVIIQPAPTAGTASNVTVCNVSPAFNLNDFLSGENTGGNWTGPGNIAVGSTFTPGTSPQGSYTYTVGDGIICPINQATVQVTVLSLPNAGNSAQITVCQTDPTFDLFNSLGGTPNAGGTWTNPQGNAFGGTFTPGTSIDGIYTYSIGTAPCNTAATVQVTTVNLPFAGNNTSTTICGNGLSVNLFGLLVGADAGGTWTDPLGNAFTGTFVPGTNQAGLYTYSLGSGTCLDEATVNVTVTVAPVVTLSATSENCAGEPFDLTFDITGNGPFNLVYSINGTESLLNNINNGHIESLTLSQTSSISIVSVVQTSGLICVGSGNSINVNITPTPTATISGGGGICAGANANITFNFSGTGPFDVVYTDGNQNYTLTGVNNGHTISVSPVSNTTFSLISMNDNSSLQCSGTVSGNVTFTISAEPQASISGNASICIGQSTNLTFLITGNGPFDVVYTDGTSNFSLNGINSGFTQSVSPQFLTSYQLVSVAISSNPTCTGSVSGSAQVTVSSAPIISNLSIECTPVNEQYIVTFDINGGNPLSYSVTGGGTLSGGSFSSNLINSGANYSFTISDGSACPPIIESGSYTCDCFTSSGSLVPNNIEVCGTENAQVFPNNDEALDANDVLIFVLHNGSANSLGTVLAMSATPSLSFQTGMSYGTTYFISAVAGNSNGVGGVNLNDPCLSVSNGIPVIFNQPPSATISGNLTLCTGQSGNLSISLTGSGPWTFSYSLNGINQGVINTNTQPYLLNVSAAGTYTLTASSDANCTGTTQGSANVIINALPTANIAGNVNLCQGSNGGPQITLTGGGPYTITYSINGGASISQNINTSPYTLQATQSGTYTLISVSNASCSGTVSGQAVVTILPLPTATISGGGQVCQGGSAQFQIIGSGNGSVSANYAINGVPAGNLNLVGGVANFSSSTAGTYTILNISDDFCTGPGGNSQAILVVNPIPTASLNVNQTSLCEGDSTLLNISFTGNGPFDLTYSIGNVTIDALNVNGINNYITPYNGQEVTLLFISDNSNPTCSQALNQSIVFQVLPAPQAPQLQDVFRCMLDEFTNIGTTALPGLSYSWFPSIGLSNPNIANPEFQLITNSSTVQTYNYTLSVGNGICTVQSSMSVTVDPGPLAGFNYTPNPVTTEATQVNFYNTTPGINQYLWTVDELYEFTTTNISFAFPDGLEGEYPVTLIATDPLTGCVREITQIIEVKGELVVYVPNSFTPNGDGINDLFGPVMRNYSEDDFSFSILNRQGEIVFSTNNTQLKWTGEEPAAEYYALDAVYLWIISVKDKNSLRTSEFRGTVTLLR